MLCEVVFKSDYLRHADVMSHPTTLTHVIDRTLGKSENSEGRKMTPGVKTQELSWQDFKSRHDRLIIRPVSNLKYRFILAVKSKS